MAMLAWKVRGLSNKDTVRALKNFVFKFNPGIIFLSEMKQKMRYLEKIRMKMKYDNAHYVEPIGIAGGLLLWWKNDVKVSILQSGKNIIDCELSEVEKGWAPIPQVNSSRNFGRKLKKTRSKLIKWNRDKFGKRRRSAEEITKKIKLLQENSLNLRTRNEVKELKVELNKIWENEERHWHQRARVDWLKYGDKNTKSEQYPDEYYSSNDNPRRQTSSSSSTTSVHVTALDGLVNVNSLFTIAVFVGLSLTTPGQHSLENRAPCDAGIGVAKKLLVFEVVSFSFFLFSSLVAQGLKLAINLLNSKDVDEAFRAHINLGVLRFGMMGSAVGSVMGCLFLMLSMVNVIEIRLGMLSCGSNSAIHAVAALVILVTSALLVYFSTAVYAFLH
ncbi:hypothetical protein V6N11_016203 [Hibiscus sabdariffa]|uniref:Uncharacterized protein n=1 Tax=Hibiscus sabdariffa TaxID=183260 RepID=A0ABR2TUA5_9ROSI